MCSSDLNCLFPIALELITGEQVRRTVEAARKHLLVPGALRSLAPLPVFPPLPIHSCDGRALNDPKHPYWGRYAGDEDTQRKPAYHNGTAWSWLFPLYAEALVLLYGESARATGLSLLGSAVERLNGGCLGHPPAICDGDAQHVARGCCGQAWGVSELLRVWLRISRAVPSLP